MKHNIHGLPQLQGCQHVGAACGVHCEQFLSGRSRTSCLLKRKNGVPLQVFDVVGTVCLVCTFLDSMRHMRLCLHWDCLWRLLSIDLGGSRQTTQIDLREFLEMSGCSLCEFVCPTRGIYNQDNSISRDSLPFGGRLPCCLRKLIVGLP